MILCNILILLYDIGTYDVINATAYLNGNSICVECVFLHGPSAKSCYVSVIGVTSMNKTFVKSSPNDVTVQGCIDNLPLGNYTVYVYDVENDIPLTSILPAIILRDIVINDILPTTASELIIIVITKLKYILTCILLHLSHVILLFVMHVIVTWTTNPPTLGTTLPTSSTPSCKSYI